MPPWNFDGPSFDVNPFYPLEAYGVQGQISNETPPLQKDEIFEL